MRGRRRKNEEDGEGGGGQRGDRPRSALCWDDDGALPLSSLFMENGHTQELLVGINIHDSNRCMMHDCNPPRVSRQKVHACGTQ